MLRLVIKGRTGNTPIIPDDFPVQLWERTSARLDAIVAEQAAADDVEHAEHLEASA
jgi:hypothetical protein